mmetsp:Transcript_7328/g.24328  ORF Transcript_7328/g.24328 Transcript_7328/m.24328 type:complete len:134 (+) Transcript_7328:251-652(+)
MRYAGKGESSAASAYILDVRANTPGVPYGKSFETHVQLAFDSPRRSSQMDVSSSVEWRKKKAMLIAGAVEGGAVKGTRRTYGGALAPLVSKWVAGAKPLKNAGGGLKLEPPKFPKLEPPPWLQRVLHRLPILQ